MTAKEKVLKVHPDAYTTYNGQLGVTEVWSTPCGGIFLGQARGRLSAEEAAWQNAAESLPAEPAPKVVYDAWGKAGRLQPVAPSTPALNVTPTFGRPTVEEILQEWSDGRAYGENSHFIKEFSRHALTYIESLKDQLKSQPDSSSIPDENVWRHLVKRMYDECGSTKADDFIRRVRAGEHDVPSPWTRDSSSTSSEPMPKQLVSEELLNAWADCTANIRKPLIRDLAIELQQWRKWAAAKSISSEQTFEEWLAGDYPDIAKRGNATFRSAAKAMEVAWAAAKGSK